MDGVGPFTASLWALTAIVQCALLGLLFARRNVGSYPAFGAYIFMTMAQSLLLYVAIRRWGFSSPVSWKIGWVTQSLVLGARAFAVAELCKHVLGRFRGVWMLARWILLGSGVVVLFYGLAAANHRWQLVLNTTELGLELATAAVIVMLLLFARYYHVLVPQALRGLAIGFCLYSCVSVMNDTILERWLVSYVPLWNLFGMAAFLACLLFWSWTLLKALPQAAADHRLTDGSLYLRIIPEVNWRLHALNDQLIRFWRLEAPPT